MRNFILEPLSGVVAAAGFFTMVYGPSWWTSAHASSFTVAAGLVFIGWCTLVARWL